MTVETGAPLLLYDGSCGFCAKSVQFLLRHERERRDLRFAALAGATGRRLQAENPAVAAGDTMAWVEGDQVWVRSDAVLRAAVYLGGGWAGLGALLSAVPRNLRDRCYRVVASHRHRLGGPVCVVPTAEQRARFVDLEAR